METLDIIKSLQDSDYFFRIIEMGAGMPISGKIFEIEGASNIIYSAESFYDKESYVQRFGSTKSRSVSAEYLKHIRDSKEVDDDICDDRYNSLIATSFQIGNGISNHGWLLVSLNGFVRYYHISLPSIPHRGTIIDRIGEICLNIIHGYIDNSMVDMVLDEDLRPLRRETLSHILFSDINDIGTVFKADGGIDRLEYITRDVDKLIVYKGSFNPPSISHLHIMEESETVAKKISDTRIKAVFALSFSTFEKGEQKVESFGQRIFYLNKLGYDVLVNYKPFYKDMYNLLRSKFSGEIIFPMGYDTANRLVLDFIENGMFNSTEYKRLFDIRRTTFYIWDRDEQTLNPYFDNIPNKVVLKHDMGVKSISSTQIRKHLADGQHDALKDLVPAQIYNHLIGMGDGI
jgi:nicotinic acid mononucleotide adenylyltransferase